jgi:hypothetical protein
VQVVQVAVEEPANAGEFDNVGTLAIAGLLACNWRLTEPWLLTCPE